MTYHERLAAAFKQIHGCSAEIMYVIPVMEILRRKTVWDGAVWMCKLTGHPKARYGYAWGHPTDSGGLNVTTVLEIPPVDSPRTAVKVALGLVHLKQTAAASAIV